LPEEQAVSGRWRALTRNYTQSLLSDKDDVITPTIPNVIEVVVDILTVAACKENPQHVHNRVMSTFGDRIRLVANLALRLNQALGEQITSSDLEIVYIGEGIGFDSTLMVDICNDHPRRNQASHGRVICTTELGLRQVEKETKADRGRFNEKILLKSKVALDSVANNIAR
jgi:hypothetical protein